MSLKIIHALKRTTGAKRRILFSIPLVNKISLASSGKFFEMVLATKCLDNIILLCLCLTILITCWIASFSSRAFSELLTSRGNRIISTFQYHYILDLRKISRCTSPTLFIAVLLSEFLPEKLRVSWRSSK